jgi:hypothetical protein
LSWLVEEHVMHAYSIVTSLGIYVQPHSSGLGV